MALIKKFSDNPADMVIFSLSDKDALSRTTDRRNGKLVIDDIVTKVLENKTFMERLYTSVTEERSFALCGSEATS